MRIAYADPPYLGCCKLYDHHHPDGMCWDDLETHEALIRRLSSEFDGYVLHGSAPSLPAMLPLAAPSAPRTMVWVKTFAAFKRNVSVAYAWEPVIVRACRKPVVTKRVVMRDWIACPITLKKGLTGAKPEAVVRWAIEMVGAQLGDELVDLYPGTGIVGRTWEAWCDERRRELGATEAA